MIDLGFRGNLFLIPGALTTLFSLFVRLCPKLPRVTQSCPNPEVVFAICYDLMLFGIFLSYSNLFVFFYYFKELYEGKRILCVFLFFQRFGWLFTYVLVISCLFLQCVQWYSKELCASQCILFLLRFGLSLRRESVSVGTFRLFCLLHVRVNTHHLVNDSEWDQVSKLHSTPTFHITLSSLSVRFYHHAAACLPGSAMLVLLNVALSALMPDLVGTGFVGLLFLSLSSFLDGGA